MHIGHVDSPHEVTLQAAPAVRYRVRLHVTGPVNVIVVGADGNLRFDQCSRLRPAVAPPALGCLHRLEQPVECRGAGCQHALAHFLVNLLLEMGQPQRQHPLEQLAAGLVGRQPYPLGYRLFSRPVDRSSPGAALRSAAPVAAGAHQLDRVLAAVTADLAQLVQKP